MPRSSHDALLVVHAGNGGLDDIMGAGLDNWLKDGNPFEIKRSEYRYEVKFGGYVRSYRDEKTGRDMFVQEDYRSVIAVPYDIPVLGYGNNTVNSLRIWDAEPVNTQ